MNISQLAAIAIVLVAFQVAYADAQYRLAPPQRHWYMFNRNNPAVDPRIAAIYGGEAYRGGLAEELSPLQRSALTDFLARYFPRLFGPTVAAADPDSGSLPPGASVIPYDTLVAAGLTPSSLQSGATYEMYAPSDEPINVPAHAIYSSYPSRRPGASANRGSYWPYPGRGHEYPPGLEYPLTPIQDGYKKATA